MQPGVDMLRSHLGAENLLGVPGSPGCGLSGSALHVSRSPVLLVGVEGSENQDVVSVNL